MPLWSRVAKIAEQIPVYYYTNKEISTDQTVAAQANLQLVNKIDIANGFSLYKINKLDLPR